MHFENNLTEDVIEFALVELESIQRKVDFQIDSIQVFKLLLKKGLVEHVRIQAKNVVAKERWRTTINKLDMWK